MLTLLKSMLQPGLLAILPKENSINGQYVIVSGKALHLGGPDTKSESVQL
jgi:hypothetical protein